jgi:hypothetical protein
MLLSWLIPGAGYGIKGDWFLFLANFITLQTIYLVGLIIFEAGVLVPVLDRASPEFAVINVFVFVAQLLNGGLGIIAAAGLAADPSFLGANPEGWASDLGTFYLLISGALNVFVMFGIWDRYYGHAPLSPAA